MPRRHFRFAARVLEHLGAELISSDDVALYELVKNGFDAAVDRARPSTVTVDIQFHLPVTTVRSLQSWLKSHFVKPDLLLSRNDVEAKLRAWLQADATTTKLPPAALERLVSLMPDRGKRDAFDHAIGAVNSISIVDNGVGMSEDDLERHFLTIGTSNRLQEHRRFAESGEGYPGGVPPTGEKGIGRLSMMRLGRDAVIRTTKADEKSVHLLTIDWRLFYGNTDSTAQEIPVEIDSEAKDAGPDGHGTTIVITDLETDWELSKAEEVGTGFLSKFLDPFRPDRRRNLVVTWNGAPINLPRVGGAYLAAAPNGLKATMRPSKRGDFSVTVDYWFTTEAGVRKAVHRSYTSFDYGGIDAKNVATVGPFDVELYHYNRRRLAAIPGIATREELREWLDEWCGGLKLYRDGVRVMPYGQGDANSSERRSTYDDWLELDARALRGRGFRVNRIQVVGCVRISRATNPLLRDQANREGLVDSDASRTFTSLLKEIVRHFVSELDQQVRPAEADLAALHDAAARAQDAFDSAVERLIEAASDGDRGEVAESRRTLQEAVSEVRIVLDDTQRALEDRQLNRIEVLELAATGVAAEAFAHDLEASLDHALAETATALSRRDRTPALDAVLVHLRSVFKTLRAQISIIKPGPAKHRRRRTSVDIDTLLDSVGKFYTSRFERHCIQWRVVRKPRDGSLQVFVVEGHVRQVLDNLVRNSIYWLKETRQKATGVEPAQITVTVDYRGRTLQFSDNGVGIAPDDTEWVFGRFNSRRKGGRGLGLYLSKELCEFNQIGFTLDGQTKNRWGRLATFVLDFSGTGRE